MWNKFWWNNGTYGKESVKQTDDRKETGLQKPYLPYQILYIINPYRTNVENRVSS